MLKSPPWKWHIPLYFFVSGLAGLAYLIAAIADWLGPEEDQPIAATGRYIAFGGVLVSLPLLIDDLGRPERFHHMLRIFKTRSPMSVGAWGLTGFGLVAGLTAALQAKADRLPLVRWLPIPAGRAPRRMLGLLGAPMAAFLGGYTGVLLAATAVPLWGRARAFLGPVFFCSAASTALAAMSLALRASRRMRPGMADRLHELELLTVAGELIALAGALRALGPFSRPLVARPWGPLFWVAGVGVGQVLPLLIGLLLPRRLGALRAAGVLAGGLATRWAIVEAGKASANDPEAAFRYHS